jgi:hypothetical protein
MNNISNISNTSNTSNVLDVQNVVNNKNNINSANLIKTLLIFYVLIASNYTDNLLSKQMKEYINGNRLIQHVIGFATIIVLITLVNDNIDTIYAIMYGIIAYTLFIFSTKLDIHWNIIVLLMLFIGYMYENSSNIKEKEIMSDPNITDEHKTRIIEKQNKYKLWILLSTIIITSIGTLLYSYRKQIQYGGNYDIFTYALN